MEEKKVLSAEELEVVGVKKKVDKICELAQTKMGVEAFRRAYLWEDKQCQIFFPASLKNQKAKAATIATVINKLFNTKCKIFEQVRYHEIYYQFSWGPTPPTAGKAGDVSELEAPEVG
jgi:hypothetical protein